MQHEETSFQHDESALERLARLLEHEKTSFQQAARLLGHKRTPWEHLERLRVVAMRSRLVPRTLAGGPVSPRDEAKTLAYVASAFEIREPIEFIEPDAFLEFVPIGLIAIGGLRPIPSTTPTMLPFRPRITLFV
jgi:hypothetical protein